MRYKVDILDKYIDNLTIKKNLNPLTIGAYENDIKDYLSFLEQNKKNIYDEDEEIFKMYFKSVEENYKKTTFIKKYSTIRGFYKYLLKNRQVSKIFEYKSKKIFSEDLRDEKNENFDRNDFQNFLESLPDTFEGARIKIISMLAVEYNIPLLSIFEIQIKDLVKYDFQKIVIVKNNKITSYDVDNEMEEILKKYYQDYAFEKRFLFGAYSSMAFNTELKKYGLNFKTLKSSMKEDENIIVENIRRIYFEIGIGDK